MLYTYGDLENPVSCYHDAFFLLVPRGLKTFSSTRLRSLTARPVLVRLGRWACC